MASNFELLNYDWEGGCYGGGEGFKMAALDEKAVPESDNKVSGLYKLLPTIIKGNMAGRIELGTEERGVLELMTLQGVKTASYLLNEGVNEIILNNLSSSGLYFYKIYVAGEMKNADKIIFIK